MSRSFAEVFPTYQTSEEMRAFLADCEITKVSTNQQRDLIRVYLKSPRLIDKKKIRDLEKDLKKKLFPRMRISIRIIESFVLSAQYTPKKLFDAYKKSILEELKESSSIDYQIMLNTKVAFSEERIMMLRMPDSIMTEQRAGYIVNFLQEVFQKRCGLDVEIRLEYYKMQTNRSREDLEYTLMNQVDEVARQYANSQEKPAAEEKKEERKSHYHSRLVRSNDPDVIYGKDFEDEEALPLEQFTSPMGDVVLRGKVIAIEDRELRNPEKSIVIFTITDFTDSVKIKLFIETASKGELYEGLKVGTFIKLKGNSYIDKFDNELSVNYIVGIRKIADFTTSRMDRSPRKRVELHCHTKMSDMDAVSDVKDIIKCAKAWGHKAIAITDHGVVQAFPDANHAVSPDEDFKVIYGCEGYLVDDLKEIVKRPAGQDFKHCFVVFDLETTGFSPVDNRIIEIGAVKIENGTITDRFSTFVNPDIPIPFHIEQLTSINDQMVLSAPKIEEALPAFMEFCKDAVMVAHNADFDMSFIEENCKRQSLPCKFTVIDTLAMARSLLTRLNRFTLDSVAKDLGISLDHHHRAVDDAECTAGIFMKMTQMLEKRNIHNLDDVNEAGKMDEKSIKKLKSYHIILLAKNDIGRVHLYQLVSEAHLKYFRKRPLIPKSRLAELREGIIIGSACEAGELFQAVVRGAADEELHRIADFYDYLEVQPVGNNMFLLENDKNDLKTIEDLQNLNRKVISLGDALHKPVVATCDVHFLNPEDEVYRRIIMAGQKFKDADNQPPLYLHTTEEMLEEFSYLGRDKAEEIVITNTNLIADMCEKIKPVRPDKCPPVIENSDATLRQICYDKAHEMYGEDLPPIVTARLERELNSIISNGYSVMYIIAQKLVWKSNEDGYLVGSRGSVGSSFVATMSGITEVNPLHPHYYCPNCHYYDFDSEEVKKYDGRAGCDMPDRDCPVCGKPLKKDGFDIPFETFLGFKGNKEPDIDLNFSGEYQAQAHKYTEVIFGTGQTFKAGTIGTLADKTAFGYVKNYYEERGAQKRICEIDRIVKGCVGVRRTTGQHPGGIVVLPHGESIYTFTPVQHPANDTTTDIITTHFDYHSIDHNLLKLDILGHDDPTMIRMLEDLTGVDAKTIPLDDPEVMSLFRSCEALKVDPEELGVNLGSLGVPEFGTEFVMQMLKDTKPSSFSDLIRISGLSHGTDVWLGNAQTLIKEGKATISTAICTRDDIMTYLIGKGLDSELSFTIMEAVRKGKGLKPEFEEEMKAHDVPDWYIWSCKKIKYMFPKAHAAAYVMMAWRIAWFKINYPLAYYAAYFSIRATSFNYELMALGKDRLKYYMEDYAKRKDTLTKAEQDVAKDMKNVWEMYCRGYEFLPIDVYQAGATRFRIIDGKLMPAMNTIDGLGDKAAEGIENGAKAGKFLSKEDFRNRTKCGKSITDQLSDLGILKDMPETNQLSIFDFVS